MSQDPKNIATPNYLLPHFTHTIALLSSYRSRPLRVPIGLQPPRVAICWAGIPALHGTFKVTKEDGEGVKFLVEKRTDYGPGGWKELFPWIECKVEVLEGWDHFGMMVSTD